MIIHFLKLSRTCWDSASTIHLSPSKQTTMHSFWHSNQCTSTLNIYLPPPKYQMLFLQHTKVDDKATTQVTTDSDLENNCTSLLCIRPSHEMFIGWALCKSRRHFWTKSLETESSNRHNWVTSPDYVTHPTCIPNTQHGDCTHKRVDMFCDMHFTFVLEYPWWSGCLQVSIFSNVVYLFPTFSNKQTVAISFVRR